MSSVYLSSWLNETPLCMYPSFSLLIYHCVDIRMVVYRDYRESFSISMSGQHFCGILTYDPLGNVQRSGIGGSYGSSALSSEKLS